MQFAVNLFRYNGERLPAREVRATPPLIGYLRVDRQVRRGPPRQLELRRSALRMPTADSVVPRWRCIGIEKFWDRKSRTEYPQAWWLRMAAPPARMSPADEDDEVEDIRRALARSLA